MKIKYSFNIKNILLFSLFLGSLTSFAQIRLDVLDEESFFIGGLSPNVLVQGKVEVNFYSSIFSNWIALHESVLESPVRDRYRISEFTTNAEVYMGTTQSGRWDIGARFKYARRRLDNNARSSPFKVFQSDEAERENVGIDKTYNGFKEIGLRIRFIPFEEVPQLTLNGGYSFSPIKTEEDQQFLGADRNNFDLNVAYYVSLNNNSYYYFIANTTSYHPSTLNEEWFHNSSGSFFIVQMLANRKIVFYPGLTYSIGYKPPFVKGKSLIKTNEQVLGILGLQFQPSDNFSLNISTAIPILIENSNKLIESVRESYSFFSIGGRILLN